MIDGMILRIANVVLVVGYLVAFVAVCVLMESGMRSGWVESMDELWFRAKVFAFVIAPGPAIAHAIRYILVGGR